VVVLDPSAASIQDALVILKHDGQTFKTPVRTDIAGGFLFDGLPPGTYSLEISHEGFRITTLTVRVPARNRTPVRVVLPLAQVVSSVDAEGNGGGQVAATTADNRDAASVDISLLEKVP